MPLDPGDADRTRRPLAPRSSRPPRRLGDWTGGSAEHDDHPAAKAGVMLRRQLRVDDGGAIPYLNGTLTGPGRGL